MTLHKISEKIPPINTYVLGRYNGGNWHDRDDQEGCVWVVVKFIRYDDELNKHFPYRWETFGPHTFSGRSIDLWCELPLCEAKKDPRGGRRPRGGGGSGVKGVRNALSR